MANSNAIRDELGPRHWAQMLTSLLPIAGRGEELKD